MSSTFLDVIFEHLPDGVFGPVFGKLNPAMAVNPDD